MPQEFPFELGSGGTRWYGGGQPGIRSREDVAKWIEEQKNLTKEAAKFAEKFMRAGASLEEAVKGAKAASQEEATRQLGQLELFGQIAGSLGIGGMGPAGAGLQAGIGAKISGASAGGAAAIGGITAVVQAFQALMEESGMKKALRVIKSAKDLIMNPAFSLFSDTLQQLGNIINAILTPFKPFIEFLNIIAQLFSASLVPILSKVWKVLAPAIDAFTSSIGNVIDEFEISKSYIIAIEQAAKMLGRELKHLAPQIAQLTLQFIKMLPSILPLIPKFVQLGIIFAQHLLPHLPKLLSAGLALGKLFLKWFIALSPLIEIISDLILLFAPVSGFFADLLISLQSVNWENIGSVMADFFDWLFDLLGDFGRDPQSRDKNGNGGMSEDHPSKNRPVKPGKGPVLAPSLQLGGVIHSGGLYRLHAGERVIGRHERSGGEPIVINIKGGVIADNIGDLAKKVAREIDLHKF